MALSPRITSRDEVGRLQSEITICRNCNNIVRERRDIKEGVWFCGYCGNILKQIYVNGNRNPYNPQNSSYEEFKVEVADNIEASVKDELPGCLISGRELNAEITSSKMVYGERVTSQKLKDVAELIKFYEVDMKGERQEYRKEQYIRYIGVCNTEFGMTNYQKTTIKHILLHIDNLRDLCHRCTFEQVVSALAVYVQRKDKRKINFDTNRFLKDVGLTEKKYIRIIEKLGYFTMKKPLIPTDLRV